MADKLNLHLGSHDNNIACFLSLSLFLLVAFFLSLFFIHTYIEHEAGEERCGNCYSKSIPSPPPPFLTLPSNRFVCIVYYQAVRQLGSMLVISFSPFFCFSSFFFRAFIHYLYITSLLGTDLRTMGNPNNIDSSKEKGDLR